MTSICIFNSFPFHYEIFGHIIHYAKKNNFSVDIYTNLYNDLGWFDFYSKMFNNISIFDYTSYTDKGYSSIFVVTDDDPRFKAEWVNDRVICLNHYYRIRSPQYKKFINVAKFKDSNLDYSVPCYPFINPSDKKQNNIVTIIGCRHGINTSIIERLRTNDRSQIILNILGRNISNCQIKGNFIINYHKNVNTSEMFKILKESSYILINTDFNKDHISGKSSSGALQMAFNSLCKPIICNNKIHNFKHCINYNESFIQPIILDKVDFELLAFEREYYINKFESIMNNFQIEESLIPKNIFQTWKTKEISTELKNIASSWSSQNPDWNYQLYDNQECESFIKEHFDKDIFDTYCKIIPGAYKADLWRYCILYIYGGVYIDIDTICIGNLSCFIRNYHFVTPIDLNINPKEGTHNLFNTFIASVPKSSILLECIKRIVYLVQNNVIPSSKLDFSGPGILGRSVNNYLNLPEMSSFVSKEGVIKGINLLKFHNETEYVSDLSGNILFQNKNGNPYIKQIYYQECKKNKTISWLNSKPF